jgi:hypothetical protein
LSTDGLLALVLRVADLLDALDIRYVVGGSVAASFYGEPRATADVDVAIEVPDGMAERLIERAAAEFYVPTASARRAIAEHDSFNLLASDGSLKVDLFVLGSGLLDRRQIERRVPVRIGADQREIWITSPADQVLRKLSWFRASSSERQWRDVIGLLRVSGADIDLDDLVSTADRLDLASLVRRAIVEAGLDLPGGP